MDQKEFKQCKKCKEQIDKKAKKCPKCGSKQGIPTWIIIVIVILVIGIIIGGSGGTDTDNNQNNNAVQNQSNNDANNSTQPTIEYIKVSKDDLDAALKNNAAAAKDTYNKKYVEVTGKLGTIDSDLKYISLLSSTDEWDMNGIYCKIKNNAQKEIVKTLVKDQEITIKGQITDVGEVLGYYLDITEIIA